MLTLAIILQCQKLIMTESKSANWNFRMYSIMGQNLVHPSITNWRCDTMTRRGAKEARAR